MLPFKVHRFQIGSMRCLLLPKMTRVQMHVISDRLTSLGYSVHLTRALAAKYADSTVRVDPSGVCWSTGNFDDSIIPAIPSILASEKEKVPTEELESMYVAVGRSEHGVRARLTTRLESYSNWRRLRESDTCALSPDEHLVACFMLRRANGSCGVLTDFPVRRSEVRIFGGRRYFDSHLDCRQVASTLRVAGAKSKKNSYLRREGLLELGRLKLPSAREWRELFDKLGEWCYFKPA
jgi:hypothetical protein